MRAITYAGLIASNRRRSGGGGGGGPTVVASDAFNRTNSADLGAHWAHPIAGIGIVGNQASATLAAGAAACIYTALTPSANARATIILRTTPTANRSFSLYLRWNSGTGDGYAVTVDGTNVTISKETGFSSSTLASATVAFASGDSLGLSANLSALDVWKNGSSVLSASDSTYTVAEPVGILLEVAGASETLVFDDFTLEDY